MLIRSLAEDAEETLLFVNDLEKRFNEVFDYGVFKVRFDDLRIQSYGQIKQLIKEAEEKLEKAIQKISEKRDNPYVL